MASHLPSTQALVCFDAVARELSVTRAAAQLNLTQSAVSRQLSSLEQGLGVTLFRRQKQRLYLTESGQNYWEEVRELLRRLHSAGQRAQGKVSGRIRLGLEPALASRWLAPRLGGFKRAYPELDIQLQTELDKLYQQPDSYDIAILYGLGQWPGLEARELMADSLLAVCAPALLQQFGPIADWADALRYPLLHHTARPSASAAWLSAAGLSQRQIEALPGSRLESFSLIAQLARQGLGLAILPDYFVAAELQAGDLVQTCPRALPCVERYFVVNAEGRSLEPGVQAVRRWLLAGKSAAGDYA